MLDPTSAQYQQHEYIYTKHMQLHSKLCNMFHFCYCNAVQVLNACLPLPKRCPLQIMWTSLPVHGEIGEDNMNTSHVSFTTVTCLYHLQHNIESWIRVGKEQKAVTFSGVKLAQGW